MAIFNLQASAENSKCNWTLKSRLAHSLKRILFVRAKCKVSLWATIILQMRIACMIRIVLAWTFNLTSINCRLSWCNWHCWIQYRRRGIETPDPLTSKRLEMQEHQDCVRSLQKSDKTCCILLIAKVLPGLSFQFCSCRSTVWNVVRQRIVLAFVSPRMAFRRLEGRNVLRTYRTS